MSPTRRAHPELNHYVEPDELADAGYDVIIVATGGLPDVGAAEGSRFATDVWDVMAGVVKPTGDVIVYDDNGANQALDAVEVLAGTARSVCYVTPERTLAPEVGTLTMMGYLEMMADYEVPMTPVHRLHGIERVDGRLKATFGVDGARKSVEHLADTVVIDHGTVPNTEVYDELVASLDQRRHDRPQRVVGGAAADLDPQPRRPLPALSHRRRREQPHDPDRGARRVPALQRDPGTRSSERPASDPAQRLLVALPAVEVSSTAAKTGSPSATASKSVIELRSFIRVDAAEQGRGVARAGVEHGPARLEQARPEHVVAQVGEGLGPAAIAYRRAVTLLPRPSTCGKTNHIQWLDLRPRRSSASAVS